ncbi:NAD(P)/FAD-dependent oxidoreductase [Rhodobacter lacus]|uniref:NAD(P)/FAD-dependent oxidoreductase n=1 Tax=Rhodobacter lacus TaxID=1641972 RepID=A0ABW5AAY9_9RHOB
MKNTSSSHGLWALSAPAAPATTPLSGLVEADVVVIGAGFTGLSAALHLAEAGKSVVVLEAGMIGFGASGRNVGLVNAGMWVMPEELPQALGPVHGPRLLEFLGNAPAEVFALVRRHGIACEAVANGTLHCAVGGAGLAEIGARARQWAARGAPVELLDGDETALRLGGGRYMGALLDMRAGTIQPLAYVRGLARAALACGAQIHTESPASAVAEQGLGWEVTTPAGRVRARWLVAATDTYTRGPNDSLRREQVGLPYFNMATPPLPEALRATILPGGEGCWDTREVLSSFRTDAAGRLVFGSVGRLGLADRALHRAWAERAMVRIFPQLKGIGFESAWFGWIGMTSNNLPRLHLPGRNAIAVSGYNGRGIAPGTVFGKAIARYICGDCRLEAMPLPVSTITPAPWRRLREAWYTGGAAALHLVADRI